MHLHKETRGAGGRARASETVLWRDTSEDALPLLERQARHLARSLGLTLDRARLLADFAYAKTGRRA
jgi:hypothetical protein